MVGLIILLFLRNLGLGMLFSTIIYVELVLFMIESFYLPNLARAVE